MNKPCSSCMYARQSINGTVLLPKRECFNYRTCKAWRKYDEYKESRRKYKQGKTIKSLAEFEKHLNGDGFFYLRGVIKHKSILISMTVRTIQLYIESGYLRAAVKKEESKK